MRQSANNTFKDGMNLDLHPIVTPNSVLTDNLNGTFITYDGNEFCLQNDRGNEQTGAKLSEGFVPIGAKEYNGVIYIISVKNVYDEQNQLDPTNSITEVGTYPGVNWNDSIEEWHSLDYSSYTPFKNLDDNQSFQVKFGYTTKTPVTIEIQPSYDGSVNLILVADNQKPRIINSGFSVNAGKYKLINRDQSVQTNHYNSNNIIEETNLIRTNVTISNVDLVGVSSGGQFKGGNYTFYIKFGDADYNQTDVVAESGIVSVFKGNDGIPSTISGTLQDERTDKMVGLKISGLNHVYSKIYIYFTREYSDLNGFRLSEAGMFTEPINMESEVNDQIIWLSGFEEIQNINVEELNIDYHTVDWARAEAQNANMLFLGNVGQKETQQLYQTLKDFTWNNITTEILQSEELSEDGDDFSKVNYYSTKNIYHKLGYWPEEYYRFGIIYILEDGSTTPVFNMCGNVPDPEWTQIDENTGEEVPVEKNKYGVFLTDKLDVLSRNKPIYFNFKLQNIDTLPDGIIGYFIVRQKRIPTTLCQGVSLRIDDRSHLPLIWSGTNWIIESFLSSKRETEEGENASKRGGWWSISGQHILAPLLKTSDDSSELSGMYICTDATRTTVEVSSSWDGDYTSFTNGLLSNYRAFAANLSGHTPTDSDIYVFDSDTYYKYTDTNSGRIWINRYKISKERIDGNWNDVVEDKYLYYFEELTSSFVTLNGAGIDINENNVSFTCFEQDVSIANESVYDYRYIKEDQNNYYNASGILSLDPCVVTSIQSQLDGSEFVVTKEYSLNTEMSENERIFSKTINDKQNEDSNTYRCCYISDGTLVKAIDDYAFSNVAGSASDAGSFKYTSHAFGVRLRNPNGNNDAHYVKDPTVNDEYGFVDYEGYNSTHNVNLIRGNFAPYIGLGTKLADNTDYLYSIKRKDNDINDYIVRKQDDSEYYCISNRYEISENSINVYGGDCYICTVAIRILRNFIDSLAPATDVIVDPTSWLANVIWKSRWGGDGSGSDKVTDIVDYTKVNISDLNAVNLGYWVKFPCLSSYNLGLRSEDRSHVDEIALLGQPRSFYPLNGASTTAGNKVPESHLLNDGYSATVGEKRYNLLDSVPYNTSEFKNRIMFSNVSVVDSYSNGYRTFQGVSFKDYDKQYGAITKLLSWGTNLFVVMEHGLALVPINEKALMQTTAGTAIHIYGHDVLPDQMTVISQDFGSKYEHSVIRTPIGIYGIDTDARKIWRFSEKRGFETISDMHIESYLNDNLFTDKEIDIQTVDIRAHYNSTKGDVMFTFYNKSNE